VRKYIKWAKLQSKIHSCRICEAQDIRYIRVPKAEKHYPPYAPPKPTKLFFVSVAPPFGGKYFWAEQPNGLRRGLFDAIAQATGQLCISLSDFLAKGFFILPGVKCPSERNGFDYRPQSKAIANCSSYLRNEITLAQPERILALGCDPMQSLSIALGFKAPPRVCDYRQKFWWVQLGNRWIPVAGTYFAGNNRHRSFEKIVRDINWILQQKPKSSAPSWYEERRVFTSM
jgi:uracil-DNA glycosylase